MRCDVENTMNRMNRREFIRLASLMGGVSLFAGCTLLGETAPTPRYIEGAPAPDPAEVLKGVQSVYSVCALCPGNCGISCRVAEGTLVKIGGNPYNPISAHPALDYKTPLDEAVRHAGSVCAIGGSGIQTLYDPFRVVKPLKRVGERGAGKWEAISWEQAIQEIVQGGDLFNEGKVAGLKQIAESREGLRTVVGRADWGVMSFLQRFVSAFPAATLTRDRETRLDDLAREVPDTVFGKGTGPVAPDYRHAATVLSFGDAPLDSGVPLVSLARDIADRRLDSSGFQWAVVDPRLSTSGSKADLWVPVRPGHDLALALGIMRTLFDRHADRIRLVGGTLKEAAMARQAKDYARESGVSGEIMNRLADMLVHGGERSAAFPGRGILAQKNGKDAAAAILTLNLMVGSVPGSGGLIGRQDGFFDDALKTFAANMDLGPRKPEGDSSTRALLLWEADPVYEDRDRAEALLRNRKEIPLFVAIHRQITETTVLADYILPDTTYLERWDVCAQPPAVAAPGVGIRRPVVGGFDPDKGRYFPIFAETRPMEEILMALALSLKLPGFGENALAGGGNLNTAWDYYQRLIPDVLTSMKQAGFPLTGSNEDLQNAIDRGGYFPSSEKLALKPQKTGESRPWQPSTRSIATASSGASLGDEEFVLITYTLPFHRAPQAGINRWLLEVLPENRLLVNTADARKLGLKTGDAVTLNAGEGTIPVSCKAQPVPGIMPGVVALAVGFGYRQCGVTPQTIDAATHVPDKTPGAGLNAATVISENRTLKVKKG
jgi:anaerobic selenocysteine-containing dehydrogenase